MFGIGRKNFNSSMIPAYLFLFILITNQFLFIHSFVLIHNGEDQNEVENSRHDAIRRFLAKYFATSEDSSSDDNDLQSLLKPTVQRRFCCMSPLSGRKRFIRDLAQKRQLSNKLNQ